VDVVTQNKKKVQFEVLNKSEETVENSIGHSDTGQREGTLSGTVRKWRACRRQQWTQ